MIYNGKRPSARAMLGAAASTLVLSALLQTMSVTTAMAQPAAPAAGPVADNDKEADEVEAVVVTGSFLKGTPETAAIPVEAVNLEEMRDKGSPSNLDFVKGLSEIGSVAGEANRNNAFAIGSQSINLRSLSSSRTVVVFNGRRFPEQYSFSVGRFNNIAQIPNAAIGRVEVLKDGGATTYGADAVGGVVNYITRRNLNGLEVSSSYRWIKDSDGDYDVSLSGGKVFDNFNVLGVFGYIHRSELDLKTRDWALKQYLENPASWNGNSTPGAYTFFVNSASALAINPTYSQILLSGSTAITAPIAGAGTSRYTGTRQISVSGVVRDPTCSEVGNFAGWSATPSPLCYQQTGPRQNLVETQDTYQAYAEANWSLSPRFKVHGEFLYYGLNIPHIPIDNGGGLVNTFPLARNPDGSLATTGGASGLGTPTGATQLSGTSAAYFVPSSNPAVTDLINRYQAATGGTTFTAAQAELLRNVSSTGALASGTPLGRVALLTGTWRPFGVGTDADLQHNYSHQYRYTLEFSGDLGKVLGGNWDWSIAGTYNTLDYNLEAEDILVDRLQSALNGLGGQNCNGIRADLAGSVGCSYFNPFSSAFAANANTGQLNPAYVGAGTFKGYVAGQGLQNDPALIDWMYVPVGLHRQSQYTIFDAVLRADFDYHLWSKEPIAFAVGGQYRELHEISDLTDFADESINPCATPGVVICGTRTSPLLFRRGANISGFVRDYNRRYPVASAFSEIRVPITDAFNVQLSTRYEKFYSDLGAENQDVVVSQAAARWQILPFLALRGTAGQTFSNANPPAPSVPNITGNNATAAAFGGGTGVYTTANYSNTGVQPEKGFNYNIGTIIQAGDVVATIDYYNIKIDSVLTALTATQVLQAITVPGTTGAGTLINCSSPLLSDNQSLFSDTSATTGRPFVQLAGACSTTLPFSQQINGARVNFFGSQGQQTALFNGPGIQTTGVDVGVKWSKPNLFWGTDVTVDADASYILTYDQEQYVIGGVAVQAGFDAVGYTNAGPARSGQRVNNWRGSLGFNFHRGNHNLNITTRIISSILSTDDTNIATAQSAFNANIGNANGFVTLGVGCATPLIAPPVPTASGTGQYGLNTGSLAQANVGFNSCQNAIISSGEKIPATFNTDMTYRVALPMRTNMSISVQNLFDADPEFSRDIINYDAYSGSPLGRTYKVSVTKKF